MPILYPDILEHNNKANYPIADSDNICGATRTAVTAKTDLYTIPATFLKQNATRVWVTGESKFYTLTDYSNRGNSSGWTADTTSASLTFTDGTTSDTISLSSETLSVLGSTNITSSVTPASNSVTISLKSSLAGDITISTGDFSITTGYLYAYGGAVAGSNGLTMQSGGKIKMYPTSGTNIISISVPTPNNGANYEIKLPGSAPSTSNQVMAVTSIASSVATMGWTADPSFVSVTASSGFFALGSTADIYTDRYFVLNTNNKQLVFTAPGGNPLLSLIHI